MRKKDTLYKANKWNQPLFMPDENLFPNGGWADLASADKAANPWDYVDDADMTQQYMNSTNAFGISKADNPFSKGNIQGGIGAMAKTPIGGALVGSLGAAVGSFANKAISGGYSSGAGNTIAGLGSTIGGAVSQVNPLLGAVVQVGSGIIGGGINALWGTKVDEQALKENKEGNNQLLSFSSNAGSFDAIKGPQGVANVKDAYAGGVFKKGWAEEKNRELWNSREQAMLLAQRGVTNNVDNLESDQINNELANYSAFGGPLGAVELDLAYDALNVKRKNAQNKDKMTNLFMGTPSLFAFGGNMEGNGADWSTGLMHINAGGSHESNPNDGVQLGVDGEGTPNLVEEGEVVFNDYVYSARINLDEQVKEKFHFPRKKDITYADAAKKLEKEIAERPNDPIYKASFKAQMETLANEQERQKAQMEAERAEEAFNALSDEEKVALMQQAAQEEAMAQEAAAQEQAVTDAQNAAQVNSEEAAMAQQQMMQADGSEAALGQEPQIMAEGGKINKFDDGGGLDPIAKAFFDKMKFATMEDYYKWQEANGIDNNLFKNANNQGWEAWQKVFADDAVKKAVNDPAFTDAVARGYNFGTVKPNGDGSFFTDPDKGNWDNQMYAGWKGSQDDAWLELVRLMKEAHPNTWEDEFKKLSREDLEKAFKGTKAYQNTTKWLQSNPENMRRYLKSVLDTSSSKSAKKHALQFVNEDGTWKDASKIPTYAQIFGENGKGVRETHPGTYWHSVREANIGNNAQNLVWNPDTESWNEVVGNVGSDWTLDGTYNWYDNKANANNAVNYYRRPVTEAAKPEAAKTPEEKAAEETTKNLAPKRSWEGLRYAGLLGPAVGLGMQLAGVGKPDTASLDAATSGAGNAALADYQPLGDYLTYRPMDIWYEQNRLNANARATDRAIMNSGANQGGKAAALLASGYNDQLASGNLFRQALEYNDAQRKQVADFNRGTNQFNADAYNQTSRFNASALNDANRASAQMKLHAASQKMDADAGWYNGIYGNVNGLFKGLSDIGNENKRDNMINWMLSKGVFGTIDTDDEFIKPRVKVVRKCKGGLINKGKLKL